MTIKELEEQLQQCLEEARSIQAKAETERRHLSEEESANIDALCDEAEGIEAEIGRRERLDENEKRFEAKMAEPEPRKTEPDQPGAGPDIDDDETAIRGAPKIPARPADRVREAKWGWRHFGEFAQAVHSATVRPDRQIDPRLTSRAATTFSAELVGTDGGFAVPPDFSNTIKNLIFDETGLLSRCDQMTSSSNAMTIPICDDSPWSTSGVVAAWEGEGDAYADKKVVLKQAEVRLNKLGVNVPVTEELLEDAPSLASYLPKYAASKINHKIDLAIVQGTGNGQPMGVLNAPAAISVAKETGQAADTIVYANVRKMWNRLYAPCRPNAIWLVNQDAEGQLMQMYWIDSESTPANSLPVYLPAGNNISNSPQNTLFGRPVIFHQACETLGDKGDILLVDHSQYLVIIKSGGIRSDVSMHFYWAQDISCFKFRIRIGGQPWWPTTLSARDGSNTYSPFINLAERA